MSFLWIHMLWLLLLVPVVIAAYIWIQRRRQKYALRYASLSLVKEALGKGPGRRRHVPPILFIIALTFMIFALSRPAATITMPSQQGTIILAIDVSGSMRAEDMEPNRIEAAKAAAKTFVEKQPKNVRIGVVSFSDNAAIVQAPTVDREAILGAITRLSTQRGTAIGRGIIKSLDAILEEFGENPNTVTGEYLAQEFMEQNSREPAEKTFEPGTFIPAMIVLLSDGQNTTGPLPLDIVNLASERGVRIYTVGVGNPEGTILNVMGRSIRVRLDEETLTRIAERTFGSYQKADNEADLREVYEKLSTKIVFKQEQTEITAGFTGLAAVLLLVSGALAMVWFNRLP